MSDSSSACRNRNYDLRKSKAGAIIRRNAPQVKVFEKIRGSNLRNVEKGDRLAALMRVLSVFGA
jgi:hypothetical protein